MLTKRKIRSFREFDLWVKEPVDGELEMMAISFNDRIPKEQEFQQRLNVEEWNRVSGENIDWVDLLCCIVE